MNRSLVLAAGLVISLRVRDVHASCAYTPPETVSIVIDSCAAVDTSKLKSPAQPASYTGVVLVGTVTRGKAKPTQDKLWVPASEKLTCTQLVPKATVTGTRSIACCDGDPNPPCWIETSSIFTKLTIAAPAKAKPVKPVKQATRTDASRR